MKSAKNYCLFFHYLYYTFKTNRPTLTTFWIAHALIKYIDARVTWLTVWYIQATFNHTFESCPNFVYPGNPQVGPTCRMCDVGILDEVWYVRVRYEVS